MIKRTMPEKISSVVCQSKAELSAMATGEKWDDKGLHTMGPGDVMIMQPKTPHYAQAKGEAIVQIHGMGPWSVNYVNPADDPKNKPAAAPKADAKKDEKKK